MMLVENEMKTVSLEELNKSTHLLFDARSPKEYEEYHLPGASSISIFSNEERAEIGTLYKQRGKEEAMERGLEIVAPKLPAIFQTIKRESQKYPDKQVVIYCARGGMRSKSVVETMNMMGLNCLQLEGGIRSYRKKIEEIFSYYEKFPKKIIVLEGHTGTMKTKLLEQLQEEGYPVVNLERMADHKGSIFGGIGETPAAQKKFESRLYERLLELEDSKALIIESESKRIGRAVVPDFLLQGKDSGIRIHLEMPFYLRVKYICELYDPASHHAEIEEAVLKLTKRLNPDIVKEIQQAVTDHNYERITALLLENYYDPKYDYAKQKYTSPSVDVFAETYDMAYGEIKNKIDHILTYGI
jgi:tRNA 2-selenouridine synthase